MHSDLAPTLTPNSNQGRVLLADDDPGVRRDFTRVLRHLGFTVEGAQDGFEAARLLETGTFDLIVSDIEMPHVGGVEFLKQVRTVDQDVPVILITGNPDVDSAMAAVEFGAFRYLTKPIGLAHFSETVRHALNMHRLALLKREALEVAGEQSRQLRAHAETEARFTSALNNLWIAFQPIVNCAEQKVFAYEALLRSNEPSFNNPGELLAAAENLGRVHDLGRRIRAHVAQSAMQAPEDVLLFVNLHSLDLNDPELYSPAAPLSAIAHRVVLEITERASLGGVGDLTSKMAALRELGFRIAIDDLGAGYAALSSFTQIEPEFVKLDMSLVRDVDTSARKQSLVRALMQLCSGELKITVVTEGVQTAAERDMLLSQGCELLQGYLFAKPDKKFAEAAWAA
ncbi:MAG TPA: EAL domain-containing protein [Polyangiaceae bacterium]|nr:EAL domain-containing protein [Polyangiaceae bacterium]